MFQRRSIAQRLVARLRQLVLGLGGFLLLQYILFRLPQSIGNSLAFNAEMLPILLLIIVVYAASALVFIRSVWRG